MLRRLAVNGAKTILSRPIGSPGTRPLLFWCAGARGQWSIREGERRGETAAARKRKRQCQGRCEGRKPLSETRPEVVALARKLRRRRPKGGQLSLREVRRSLATQGYFNERGKPYAAKSVASMLA